MYSDHRWLAQDAFEEGGHPRDAGGKFTVHFRQPGTASKQKRIEIEASSEEHAVKAAKKQMQQHGTGWRHFKTEHH